MSELIDKFHVVADAQDTRVGLLFEQVVREIYQAWLKPGDSAVDVGAHKGMHLFPMSAAVGPTGRIYAFEPIGKLFNNLKRDLKKNGTRNVKLFQLALGNESVKTAAFSYFENRPAYSGLKRRNSPFSAEQGGLTSMTVNCATLDSKLPMFRKMSVIKLDIEGGELHALMGARKCLKKSRPLVVFENGRQDSADVYGYTADDFFRFFADMDMKVFWLSGEKFVQADWRKNRRCWEFVALPSEKEGFAETLPDLCRKVLAAAGS